MIRVERNEQSVEPGRMTTRQVSAFLAVSALLVAGALGAIDSHKITSLPGYCFLLNLGGGGSQSVSELVSKTFVLFSPLLFFANRMVRRPPIESMEWVHSNCEWGAFYPLLVYRKRE